MKYLKRIHLKNILGLGIASDEFDVELNQSINVALGPNASGKSRLLKAIRTFFSDKIKMAWLRTEDQGQSEMELYLTDGSKVEIDISEKGSATRKFWDSIGKAADKMSILDFISFLAVDPALFLDPKGWADRIKITVSALDYKIVKETWIEKVGVDNLPLINFSEIPITQLEDGKKYYEEKRRDFGRLAKQTESTIENLKRTLPDKIDIDFDEKISVIDEMIQEANDDQRKDEDSQLGQLRKDRQVLVDEISELKLRIEKLTGQITEIDEKGKAVKLSIENKFLKIRQDLNSQKESWQEEKKKAQKSIVTQELIDQNVKTLESQDESWTKYDNFLKMIDAWKKEIAAMNPIAGLEIGQKDLIVDGRPWEVANTARQIEMFFHIANLHIAKLPDELRIPLLLCDDLEHLDDNTLDILVPEIIRREFQAVFAMADPRKNSELKILNHIPKREIVE